MVETFDAGLFAADKAVVEFLAFISGLKEAIDQVEVPEVGLAVVGDLVPWAPGDEAIVGSLLKGADLARVSVTAEPGVDLGATLIDPVIFFWIMMKMNQVLQFVRYGREEFGRIHF